MSRICGIVSYGLNKDKISHFLDQMTISMKCEDWHRADKWQDATVGLGHTSILAVNEEEQPIYSEDENLVIVGPVKYSHTKKIIWFEDFYGKNIGQVQKIEYVVKKADSCKVQ